VHDDGQRELHGVLGGVCPGNGLDLHLAGLHHAVADIHAGIGAGGHLDGALGGAHRLEAGSADGHLHGGGAAEPVGHERGQRHLVALGEEAR
jgi:hypothetical protein